MKIAVLYNTGKEGGFLPEDMKYAIDAVECAKNIEITFNSHGHYAKLIEIKYDSIKKILFPLKGNADAIFNLTENVNIDSVLEVIDSLEKLNLPFVGAGVYGHKLTYNKILVKKFLTENNFPTPKFQIIYEKRLTYPLPNLKFPLIIKASKEHGSMSVHQDAIVTNQKQADERINFLFQKYFDAPVLLEEYIDGNEVNSTVIGNENSAICLPLSEMTFIRSYKNKWPIYTYEAKYNHKTPDFDDATCELVNWLSKEKTKEIAKMSIKICQITKCFDYTRFDLRYDKKNMTPYIIDINTYPSILDDPKTDTVSASRLALGWNLATYLEKLAESGIKRWKENQK